MKILLDFNNFCDHIVSARRPDFTVVDKAKNLVTLVDVSIPADTWVIEKEDEKISKYQNLRIELKHLWKKKTRIIPVVIGAVSGRFKDFVDLKGTNPYPCNTQNCFNSKKVFSTIRHWLQPELIVNLTYSNFVL